MQPYPNREPTLHVLKYRQHFVNFLAEAMDEVTSLRNKYQDFGAWFEDEDYGNDEGGIGFDKWYQDESGHHDIGGGIGGLGCQERISESGSTIERTTIKA